MRFVSRLALGTVALTIVLAASDAGAQGIVLALPADDQQALTKYLGPGVVGAARPSEQIVDASAYFPLVQEKMFTYQITTGSNAGKSQTHHLRKARRPSGVPAWRFALSASLAGFINTTPSGDLVMPAVSDSEDGVVVVATPANPFVIQGIKPGESRSFTQTISVNYLDDPSRQDYAGNLNGTYSYVGTYQVTVPAGVFDAILVRLDYEGKIGPAHVKDRSWYFFARGAGIVAMVNHEDVSAFWIYNVHTTTGRVLVGN